jgi:hypothetical protein
VETFEEWIEFWAHEDSRVIAQTGNENIMVSTIFTGINYRFFEEGPPIVFETMVFGGKWNEFQYRYCTYDEAMAGHKKIVEEVFGYVTSQST